MSVSETLSRQEDRRPLRNAALVRSRHLNSYDLEERVNRAANSTIDGLIAQDRNDFDGASLQFSLMLQTMFPEYDSDRLMQAAKAYVSALFVQSNLKDEHADSFDRMHDERWEFVHGELVRMSRLLEVPVSFAIETEEFWRHHASRDDSFVKHIIEFHRALVKRLTGSERYFKSLAALYFAGLTFHDERTPYSIALGREVARIYYRILFRVMNGEDIA